MDFRRKKVIVKEEAVSETQVRMNEVFISLLRYRINSRDF